MKAVKQQRSRNHSDRAAHAAKSEPAGSRGSGSVRVRTADDVLELQRTGGNRATVQALTVSRAEENVDRAKASFEAGQRLFAAQRYGAAAIRFERARQVPGLGADVYPVLLYDLGQCNMQLERFATATMYFEQALSRGMDSRQVEPLLRQAREGTKGDAERIMNREGGSLPGASSDPATQTSGAQSVFREGVAQFEAGQFRRAIILWEQLREMELSENAEAVRQACLRNIGRANMRLGRYATAIVYLEQAIDMTPDAAERRLLEGWLGTCLERTGALSTVDQAKLMHRMATEAFGAGNHQTALARFRVILTVRGLDQHVLDVTRRNIGMCHYELGDLEQARTHLAPYVAAHPEDTVARQQLDEINNQVPAG